MPFNLLILPFLGGFFFVVKFHKTRLELARYEHKLILLYASIAGTAFLLLSFILSGLFQTVCTPTALWIDESIRKLFRIKSSSELFYINECLLSMLLGLTVWYPANKKWRVSQVISSAIIDNDDKFELLCYHAYYNRQAVLITLKNDKVYLGYIKSLPAPFDGRHLEIIPISSGYRNELKRLQLTEHYYQVYSQSEKDKEGGVSGYTLTSDLDKISVVIRIDEITTSSLFQPQYFEHFGHVLTR